MKIALLTALISFAAGASLVAFILHREYRAGLEAGARMDANDSQDPEALSGLAGDQSETTGYQEIPTKSSTFEGVEITLTGIKDHWQVGYNGPSEKDLGPGNGYTTVFHVPADSNVRLRLKSHDYVYLVSLPRINKSQIAMPGQEFHLDFHSLSPGEFILHGDHLCGPAQSTLTMTAHVDSKSEFESWLGTKDRSGHPHKRNGL